MKDMDTIYSTEHGEEIEYYISDLSYSATVLGCGLDTGRGYYLTFDNDNRLEDVQLIED